MSRSIKACLAFLFFHCWGDGLFAAAMTRQVNCSVELADGGSLVDSDPSACSLGSLAIQQAFSSATLSVFGDHFITGSIDIGVSAHAQAAWGNTGDPNASPEDPLVGAAGFDFFLSLLAITPGPVRPGELSLFIDAMFDTADCCGVAKVDIAGQTVIDVGGLGGGQSFIGVIPITLGVAFPVSIELQGSHTSHHPADDPRPGNAFGGAFIYASAMELSGESVPISAVPEPYSALTLFSGVVVLALLLAGRSSVTCNRP